VAGRLRDRLGVWRETTTDPFVLGVVEHGLELPLIDGGWPERHHDDRNFIRSEDAAWARATVEALVATGAVRRWSDLAPELRAVGMPAGDRPHVIMPILCSEKAGSTPENKKLRFIHDCRFLNELLARWHFTLEQLRDFVKCLEPGDGLIKLDLTSAYHHVDVALRFQTLLGFCHEGVDYVWAVLPFGLSVAGYTFCRVAAVIATNIRERGLVNAMIACSLFGFGGSPHVDVDVTTSTCYMVPKLTR